MQPPEPLCSGRARQLPDADHVPAARLAKSTQATWRYPVVFMHDGQNIFDDHDCCFGHAPAGVNVQLDIPTSPAARTRA